MSLSVRLALYALLVLFIGTIAWARWAPHPRAHDEVVTLIASNRPAPVAGGATSARARSFSSASPYPPGRWRSAARSELERIVLWPSHLLVRYAGVGDPSSVSFVKAGFRSLPPAPTRSRAEALALAKQLAAEARAEPARFAELVRQHSEDLVRREAGGSLGGISAAQLTDWPEVLDALSALAPGEISEPVETQYGFHLLQRRPPPAPDTVSGRRLIVGHTETQFLGALAIGAAPTRSREEALVLARSIHAKARAQPERFGEFVQRYSELRDRVLGGDFGTWSNREPSPFPREVEVLDRLEVGEVSPPFESLLGVEILQRVPNRERPEYAIDGFKLRFDPKAPAADPSSSARVFDEARALNQSLLESPALLEELQARHPRVVTQFEEGRGAPDMTAALSSIGIGQFIPEPVRSASSFVLGRRASPREWPAGPAPLFELPAN
jgi:hypothetical protein